MIKKYSLNPGIIGQAVELSIANFLNGYNCAESVLLAMSSALNLESEVVPAVATGFGGGFGRQGSVCGAISGGVMAIGLAYGRTTPDQKEDKEEIYALSLLLYRKFTEHFGTSFCKELIPEDISTPEGQKAAFEKRLHETKCIEYVAFATQTGLELLVEEPMIEGQAYQMLDG